MEVDTDRLIKLVQGRPELYDFTLKDHHNQDVTLKLWLDIAEEMNIPVADCKAKWHSLRTSYARHLRDLKNPKNKSSKVSKKVWYMADAMSFLQNYIGQQKKTSKFPVDEEDTEPWSETVISELKTVVSELKTEPIDFGSHPSSLSSSGNEEFTVEMTPKKRKIVPLERERDDETNMPAYFKSLVSVAKKIEDDPMYNFFKSVLPDVMKLNPRRQRYFKAKVLDLVNSLSDEQEDEITTHSATPTSDYSAWSVASAIYSEPKSSMCKRPEPFGL